MDRVVKKFISTSLFLLISCLASAAHAEGTLNLEQCYKMALNQSETVAIQEQTIQIAAAHYIQALGTLLPHISIIATEQLQQQGNSQNSGGLGSTVAKISQPQVALNLTQTLFQGLRDIQAMNMSKAERSKNTFTWLRAKQLLFSDVANAYFTVLEMERQVAIYESMRATLQKWTVELEERIRLGKSRESERLAVESQKAAVEADIELSRGLVLTSRDMLAFLVGREVKEKLVDDFQVPKGRDSLESHLEVLETRPDLSAAVAAVAQAKYNVFFQKGGQLPSLNVGANYYPYRVGFYKDIHFDALFTLNVPLYMGGITHGLIEQAQANFRQQELQKQETFRQADTDVRQSYDNLNTSRSRDEALLRSESMAQASATAQAEDYRMGMVKNVDVLQSLKDWQQARVEENLSRYNTKMNYVQLKVSEGSIALPEVESEDDFPVLSAKEPQ